MSIIEAGKVCHRKGRGLSLAGSPTSHVSPAFKALSDETRLRALKFFEQGELYVCNIVATFAAEGLVLPGCIEGGRAAEGHERGSGNGVSRLTEDNFARHIPSRVYMYPLQPDKHASKISCQENHFKIGHRGPVILSSYRKPYQHVLRTARSVSGYV
jgi:hypothetical protein